MIKQQKYSGGFSRNKRHTPFSVSMRYILLCAGLFIMVLPMVYMVSSSLKPNDIAFSYPIRLIPTAQEATVSNYDYVLHQKNFFTYVGNTLIVASATTLFSAALSSMLAYCISRFRFPGRNFLYSVIITTMLIPGLAMLVPQFEIGRASCRERV